MNISSNVATTSTDSSALHSSLGALLSYERNAYGELVCFRYYDPELVRYISQDPIRFAGGTLALQLCMETAIAG